MNLHRTNTAKAPVRPANCQLLTDAKDGSTTLVVPPLGFQRAPKFPFLTAGFWLAFVSYFTIQCLMERTYLKGAWAGIEVAAVLGLFWFAGLYLLAVACRLAEKRAPK